MTIVQPVNGYYEVPRSVATCPYCDSDVLLDVHEWGSDTGVPTEAGCYVCCKASDSSADIDGDDHYHMPYVHWLPIQQRVYRWARDHVRIGSEREIDLLRAWNAGEPIRSDT